MQNKNILVPFTASGEKEIAEYNEIAGIDWLIKFDSEDNFSIERVSSDLQNNDLILKFYELDVSGLIVFTSGSTGKPKGILQNCDRVLKKFIESKRSFSTVLFLMMDHFGGFNTMLSVFAGGGLAICLPNRKTETVCRVIERSKAELLPTTPTFLNLLLNSGDYNKFDLSSLKLVTYGTELIAPATLKNILGIFPDCRIKQTYGLSELGVLHSQSENDGSDWVKVGGKGFETRIIDNILWIRSEAGMVGYLNAPNPMEADGWMSTGDMVETKGEYIRFLGRKSDIINVGGQKVFPAEVESVLMEDENVLDATVLGQPNQIMGNMVVARLLLKQNEEKMQLIERLRKLCLLKLAKFKVPVKFVVTDEPQYNARYKKIRKDI
jgi:acyl-CoA synthetase (AMP-forming)/AMP-acid ligase II